MEKQEQINPHPFGLDILLWRAVISEFVADELNRKKD